MVLNDSRHTFIPKTAAISQKGGVAHRTFGLFFGVSLAVFIVVAGAAAGAYAYNAYLTKRVASLSTSLERAKAAFEPDTIVALKRFNARTNAADALLSRHIAPSAFFEALHDLTLQSVRFSKMTFAFDGSAVKVSLSGMARNYSSVALQSDIFARSSYVKNPVFSNLNLDKAGNVVFDVDLNVDAALILYKHVALLRAEAESSSAENPAP